MVLGDVVEALVALVSSGAGLELVLFAMCAVVAFVVLRSQGRELTPAEVKQLREAKKASDLVRSKLSDDGAALDLREHVFETDLPLELAELAKGVTTLSLAFSNSEISLAPLTRLRHLTTLALVGPPLTRANLAVLESIPQLKSLDLRECRTVVDDDNNIAGFCKAEDIFNFQERKKLDVLLLPRVCAIQLGELVKPFPKQDVAVVALTKPLSVGNIVLFQRIFQTYSTQATREMTNINEKVAGHKWYSQQSVVDSIRTDDHRQLETAVPSPSVPFGHIDTQFAIKVTELGQKGDRFLWLGTNKAALQK